MPPGSLVIDISQAQQPIDWQAVKTQGIAGVMIRATQGVRESVPVGVDTAFVAHIEGALASGIPVGVYHSYIGHRDALAQAAFFTLTTAPYHARLTLGYAIDVELDYGLSADVITEGLYELTRALDNVNHAKPAIYTNLDFWTNHVSTTHDDYFGQCPLWLAAWGATNPILPHGFKSIALHQYGKETVAGQLIDINRVPPAKFTLLHPVQASEGCQIVVTSRFGVARDYDGDGIQDDKHEGTDFAPIGNVCQPNIVACADGVVESISTVGAYGNRIKIRHDVGADVYYTWYCHLSVIEVAAGARVKRGQVIGVMGSTGNSTGTHLHLNLQHIGHGLSGFVIADAVNPEHFLVQ